MALHGFDISNWQADIDLDRVDFDFMIAKATEGTGYVDKTCDGFVQKALALGKGVGVYHFARTGDPIAQADYFVNNIKGYIGKAVLFLDWENAGDYDLGVLGQGPAWAKRWLDRVYELTGVRPMIYMSKSVCREYDWSAVAKDYALWMAQYPNYDETGYQNDPWTDSGGVGAFPGWVIHQYTSSGRLSGYGGHLDLDIFYGDKNAWNKFAGGTGDVKPSKGDSKKSVDELAKEVLNGAWGNGDDRKKRLTAVGYDYNAVQNRVNELVGGSNTKSVDELANEVLAGKWGNGDARKNALQGAGYDYNAVQNRVNELLGSKKSVDEIAREVIQGKWGNGNDRKNRLTQAGYDYNAVQARVNELL